MPWKSAEDKKKRAEIFQDTLAYLKENETLKKAVVFSIENNKFYPEIAIPAPGEKRDVPGVIEVSEERSFESAIRLSKENPEKKVAVLNFASASNPGGGVVHGAGAQEECLCRTSTLYPALDDKVMRHVFYNQHKYHGNNLHNDDCIYTPGVVICKTDTAFPERVPEEEFVTVDIITCAAPNLNPKNTKRYSGDNPMVDFISDEDLYKLHYKRCCRILEVAAENSVDILILGAFGCGAFKNDPKIVAKAMHDASKAYANYFDKIVFAIKKGRGADSNYNIFANEMA